MSFLFATLLTVFSVWLPITDERSGITVRVPDGFQWEANENKSKEFVGKLVSRSSGASVDIYCFKTDRLFSVDSLNSRSDFYVGRKSELLSLEKISHSWNKEIIGFRKEFRKKNRQLVHFGRTNFTRGYLFIGECGKNEVSLLDSIVSSISVEVPVAEASVGLGRSLLHDFNKLTAGFVPEEEGLGSMMVNAIAGFLFFGILVGIGKSAYTFRQSIGRRTWVSMAILLGYLAGLGWLFFNVDYRYFLVAVAVWGIPFILGLFGLTFTQGDD